MKTVAVLPIKPFDDAKHRLAEALTPGTRKALAEAMVSDVLTALRRSSAVDAVVVVTGSLGAEALARAHDAVSIGEPAEPGHSEAASHGVRWVLERGAERVVLVPGDCPLLDQRELDALLGDDADGADVVIVPDREGSGTNALVLTPPAAIAPSFGPGSRERHEQAATAAGLRWRIAGPASLAHDVDSGDDLDDLVITLASTTGGAAHTRGLLTRLGRLERPRNSS